MSPHGTLQLVVAVIALGVAMGFLCRLALLNIAQHRLSICLLHACIFGGALSSLFRAATLSAGINDLLYLAGAGLWLLVSVPAWSRGVPLRYARQAQPRGT